MMRKMFYLFIISAVILFTVRNAYPQAIIRVSPDGSLVIQDCYGDSSKRSSERKNVIDMVDSNGMCR